VTTTCGRSPPSVGELPLAQGAGREFDQGVGVALRRGAQINLSVGARARRGQRAQRAAEDFGGLPVQPSGQLIAPVPVVEAQRPASLSSVVRATPVLIEISEDPPAQDRRLAGVEGPGVTGQLGLDLGPLLFA
jgi:hypothetical protein